MDFQPDVSITSAAWLWEKQQREEIQSRRKWENVQRKLNGQAHKISAQINQFLKSLGLYDSICVECSSETLRICHTSWQGCYLLYIFKCLTLKVISEKKNITQIKMQNSKIINMWACDEKACWVTVFRFMSYHTISSALIPNLFDFWPFIVNAYL